MCGIAGIWHFDRRPITETELSLFNDAMIHRGPDGHDTALFEEVGLGLAHRRLSILDVSEAGSQPMRHRDGRYTIVFNGEVFNFIELRSELEQEGARFSSDTDTEVILEAYIHWGEAAFHRFNGMWAIAIYDEQSGRLLLCRDRFGIKPLYYLDSPTLFAFASETNAFRHLEGHARSIDPIKAQIAMADTHALEEFGHTLFEDIYQLLPGHSMSMRRGDRPKQQRWYDVRKHIEPVTSPYDTQVEEYRALFADCCALRMRSDVSLATALSGGVDSSAVYGMVHRLMSESKAQRTPEEWQRAFVMTFPGSSVDERVWAEKAVEFTGGKATYLEPQLATLSDDIVSTTQAFDAVSTTPIIALMGAYQGMRAAGVTVSLDGHGVDEMLYGYKKLVYEAYQYYSWEGSREMAESIAEVLASLFSEEERGRKKATYRADIDKAMRKRSSITHKLGRAVRAFRPEQADLTPGHLLEDMSDSPYDFSDLNALEQPVYLDFFRRTLPNLLRNFDKASMMSSIEIRMPFMDYRLVEKTFALPMSSKLGGGYTKRILRDAMVGIMPEANRCRTYKVGLGAPTAQWLYGEISELVKDTLDSTAFTSSQIVDAKKTASRYHANDGQDQQEAIAVWKALNMHWIQQS